MSEIVKRVSTHIWQCFNYKDFEQNSIDNILKHYLSSLFHIVGVHRWHPGFLLTILADYELQFITKKNLHHFLDSKAKFILTYNVFQCTHITLIMSNTGNLLKVKLLVKFSMFA